MTRKAMLLVAGIAGVITAAAGAILWQNYSSAEASRVVARWQRAASALDEPVLDAAIDKDALTQAYLAQLRAETLKALQGDDELARLNMASAVLESQSSELEALAREYASTRGLRGLLQRCDPRTQTDEGFASTKAVLPTLHRVSGVRAELTCTMSNGTSKVRAILEKDDHAGWRVTRVELPSPLPEWNGQPRG